MTAWYPDDPRISTKKTRVDAAADDRSMSMHDVTTLSELSDPIVYCVHCGVDMRGENNKITHKHQTHDSYTLSHPHTLPHTQHTGRLLEMEQGTQTRRSLRNP